MSLRLPIYRSLNKRVEIFGLSLFEITTLVCVFVFLTELLRFVPYRSLITLVLVLLAAGVMRQLNRKYERNFLLRLIRFASLPERLDRRFEMKKR